MAKLLTQYRDNPTYKLAQRIRAYERSHSMVACMLDTAERNLLADAIHHANRGA